MVELLLGGSSRLKHVFIWGDEKCDVTRSMHPLNPDREIVLKIYE
jgi:hypothetical protein